MVLLSYDVLQIPFHCSFIVLNVFAIMYIVRITVLSTPLHAFASKAAVKQTVQGSGIGTTKPSKVRYLFEIW